MPAVTLDLLNHWRQEMSILEQSGDVSEYEYHRRLDAFNGLVEQYNTNTVPVEGGETQIPMLYKMNRIGAFPLPRPAELPRLEPGAPERGAQREAEQVEAARQAEWEEHTPPTGKLTQYMVDAAYEYDIPVTMLNPNTITFYNEEEMPYELRQMYAEATGDTTYTPPGMLERTKQDLANAINYIGIDRGYAAPPTDVAKEVGMGLIRALDFPNWVPPVSLREDVNPHMVQSVRKEMGTLTRTIRARFNLSEQTHTDDQISQYIERMAHLSAQYHDYRSRTAASGLGELAGIAVPVGGVNVLAKTGRIGEALIKGKKAHKLAAAGIHMGVEGVGFGLAGAMRSVDERETGYYDETGQWKSGVWGAKATHAWTEAAMGVFFGAGQVAWRTVRAKKWMESAAKKYDKSGLVSELMEDTFAGIERTYGPKHAYMNAAKVAEAQIRVATERLALAYGERGVETLNTEMIQLQDAIRILDYLQERIAANPGKYAGDMSIEKILQLKAVAEAEYEVRIGAAITNYAKKAAAEDVARPGMMFEIPKDVTPEAYTDMVMKDLHRLGLMPTVGKELAEGGQKKVWTSQNVSEAISRAVEKGPDNFNISATVEVLMDAEATAEARTIAAQLVDNLARKGGLSADGPRQELLQAFAKADQKRYGDVKDALTMKAKVGNDVLFIEAGRREIRDAMSFEGRHEMYTGILQREMNKGGNAIERITGTTGLSDSEVRQHVQRVLSEATDDDLVRLYTTASEQGGAYAKMVREETVGRITSQPQSQVTTGDYAVNAATRARMAEHIYPAMTEEELRGVIKAGAPVPRKLAKKRGLSKEWLEAKELRAETEATARPKPAEAPKPEVKPAVEVKAEPAPAKVAELKPKKRAVAPPKKKKPVKAAETTEAVKPAEKKLEATPIEAEPTPAAKTTPVAKPKKPIAPTRRRLSEEVDVKMAKVNVDLGRFQKRADAKVKLDEAQVQNIMDNWNPDAADIILWKDPKTGKDYVLKGHHTHEAARRLGVEDVRVKYYEGTEKEAADFARASNRQRALSLTDHVVNYRDLKAEGKTEAEIKKYIGKEYSKARNMASLKEGGRFINEANNVDTDFSKVRQYASRVGELRRRRPDLTDAHEEEIFDFLYKEGATPDVMKGMEYIERVLEKRTDILKKNPETPLLLKHDELIGYDARADVQASQSSIDRYKAQELEIFGEIRDLKDIVRKADPKKTEPGAIAKIEKSIASKETALARVTEKKNRLIDEADELLKQTDLFGGMFGEAQPGLSVKIIKPATRKQIGGIFAIDKKLVEFDASFDRKKWMMECHGVESLKDIDVATASKLFGDIRRRLDDAVSATKAGGKTPAMSPQNINLIADAFPKQKRVVKVLTALQELNLSGGIEQVRAALNSGECDLLLNHPTVIQVLDPTRNIANSKANTIEALVKFFESGAKANWFRTHLTVSRGTVNHLQNKTGLAIAENYEIGQACRSNFDRFMSGVYEDMGATGVIGLRKSEQELIGRMRQAGTVDELPPKLRRISDELTPIYDRIWRQLKILKPELGYVENYATRAGIPDEEMIQTLLRDVPKEYHASFLEVRTAEEIGRKLEENIVTLMVDYAKLSGKVIHMHPYMANTNLMRKFIRTAASGRKTALENYIKEHSERMMSRPDPITLSMLDSRTGRVVLDATMAAQKTTYGMLSAFDPMLRDLTQGPMLTGPILGRDAWRMATALRKLNKRTLKHLQKGGKIGEVMPEYVTGRATKLQRVAEGVSAITTAPRKYLEYFNRIITYTATHDMAKPRLNKWLKSVKTAEDAARLARRIKAHKFEPYTYRKIKKMIYDAGTGKSKLTSEDIADYMGDQMIQYTQFRYDIGESPKWIAKMGPAGRIIGQFSTWSFHFTHLLSQNIANAAKYANTKGMRKEAVSSLATVFGLAFLPTAVYQTLKRSDNEYVQILAEPLQYTTLDYNLAFDMIDHALTSGPVGGLGHSVYETGEGTLKMTLGGAVAAFSDKELEEAWEEAAVIYKRAGYRFARTNIKALGWINNMIAAGITLSDQSDYTPEEIVGMITRGTVFSKKGFKVLPRKFQERTAPSTAAPSRRKKKSPYLAPTPYK